MKRSLIFASVVFAAAPVLRAWLPSDWVYMSWPFAYEHGTGKWYWFHEADDQWVYTFPPGDGTWQPMQQTGLRETWSYYAWPSAYGHGAGHWYFFHPGHAQLVVDLGSSEWSVFGQSAVDERLATETIHFLTTQNGNLNNRGLAISDSARSRHLYSVGRSVRAFDPATGETSTVFTLHEGGRPTFLNVRNDEIFFIEARDGWLMKYVIPDGALVVLNEALHAYAGHEQSSLHVKEWQNLSYFEGWAVRRFGIPGSSFGSVSINNAEHVNLSTARIWYTLQDGTTIMMRDAFTGSGRVDIARLHDHGVQEILEMVMDRSTAGDHRPLIGLILRKDDHIGLYRYQALAGYLEGELMPVAGAGGGGLHSLAFNGTHFYFINESGHPGIFRVHKESGPVEKVLDLQVPAVNLNFVNHWLYFGERDTSILHRLHPVTGVVETLRE